MSQIISKDQLASHNKSDSLWIVIDEDVYDLTKFQDDHPGKSLKNSLSTQEDGILTFLQPGGKKSMLLHTHVCVIHEFIASVLT